MTNPTGSTPRGLLLRAAALWVGVSITTAGALADAVVKVLVQDSASKPIVGAQVVLTPAKDDGSPNASLTPNVLKSDKKGKATFGFTRPGRYLLAVTSEGLALNTIAIKMRDGSNKVLLLPDGTRLEDSNGPVPAGVSEVQLSIHPKLATIDVVATMGAPVAAAPMLETAAPVITPDQKELQDASAAIQAGQFEQGLKHVDDAIAANPELMNAAENAIAVNYLKGYALANLERAADAEPYLREALRLNPDLPGGWRLLARTLLAQGKWEPALEALDSALTKAGDDTGQRSRLLFLRGQALLELERYADAVVALDESHRLAPADQDVLVQLINALSLADRNADAEALINSNPLPPRDGAVLHFNIAVAQVRSSKLEGAAEHLLKALELDPQMVDAHRLLGDVYLGLGKRAEAIAQFELYLQKAPDAPNAGDIKKVIDAIRKSK